MQGEGPWSLLAVNAGSSSVKFALFEEEGGTERGSLRRRAEGEASANASADEIAQWIESQRGKGYRISAIGHRIVHGGDRYAGPAVIDDPLIAALRELEPFAPAHLPGEVRLIEECRVRFPGVPQTASFDTAFHRALPRVAQILPLPRRYERYGVRRYGFHGLSYAFLMDALSRAGDGHAARGRVVLAHLGSGASMAAVKEGRPVDTTMAFTPASGIPMSTRAGDIDPGIAEFLFRKEGMTIEGWNAMIAQESGLRGIAETTGDMKELLARESDDVRAAEAVDYFCSRARQQIGAYAAAMGGLDALVFSGGMGDQAPAIRARICEGLAFLGIAIDAKKNEEGNASSPGEIKSIAKDEGACRVFVIHTDEAAIIAKEAYTTIKGASFRHQ
jgi:acetate kinase